MFGLSILSFVEALLVVSKPVLFEHVSDLWHLLHFIFKSSIHYAFTLEKTTATCFWSFLTASCSVVQDKGLSWILLQIKMLPKMILAIFEIMQATTHEKIIDVVKTKCRLFPWNCTLDITLCMHSNLTRI